MTRLLALAGGLACYRLLALDLDLATTTSLEEEDIRSERDKLELKEIEGSARLPHDETVKEVARWQDSELASDRRPR